MLAQSKLPRIRFVMKKNVWRDGGRAEFYHVARHSVNFWLAIKSARRTFRIFHGCIFRMSATTGFGIVPGGCRAWFHSAVRSDRTDADDTAFFLD
jgi:hypothetical protein